MFVAGLALPELGFEVEAVAVARLWMGMSEISGGQRKDQVPAALRAQLVEGLAEDLAPERRQPVLLSLLA